MISFHYDNVKRIKPSSFVRMFFSSLRITEPAPLNRRDMAVDAGQKNAVHDMFQLFCDPVKDELTPLEIQAAHELIRMGGISLPQVCKL